VTGNGEMQHASRYARERRARARFRQFRPAAKEVTMPARTEKQRRFMGAELQRKREGKKTQTGMSENELEKMASKPDSKKKS
jgi:hypothetical protein